MRATESSSEERRSLVIKVDELIVGGVWVREERHDSTKYVETTCLTQDGCSWWLPT